MGSALLKRRVIVFFLLYFIIAAVTQHVRGAMESSFGGDPDEPSHYMNSLMVRDYLVLPDPAHPLRYAENYYIHYPKLGIGNWPPFFYILNGGWMIPFGTTRTSVILLMCLFSAVAATTIFSTIRRHCGNPISFSIGVLFLMSPLIQMYGGEVMTEMPLAVFCTIAALCFGRFLDTGSNRDLLGFGVFAIMAIMTKGNGFVLALAAPLAIIISGRWAVLKQRYLWITAAVVLLVCAPWYYLFADIARGNWAGSSPSIAYFTDALPFYSITIMHLGGIIITIVACAGLTLCLKNSENRGLWCSLAALLASIVLFHSIIPSSREARHMVLAAPAWFIFAGMGLWYLLKKIPYPSWMHGMLVIGLIAGSFYLEVFELTRKEWFGYEEAAKEIIADTSLRDSVLLVSSDVFGEGNIISEIAMHERRPDHIVLRGTKVLADCNWIGECESLFSNVGQLSQFLYELPVGAVILDESLDAPFRREHEQMVSSLIRQEPEKWELRRAYDISRRGQLFPKSLKIYRQIGHDKRKRSHITVQQALGQRRIPDY